jgi:hypothetical protein
MPTDTDRRNALQRFLTSVIPHFRNAEEWEDLVWNIIQILTSDQLIELTNDFENDKFIEMNRDVS